MPQARRMDRERPSTPSVPGRQVSAGFGEAATSAKLGEDRSA